MKVPRQIDETVAGWCVVTFMPEIMGHSHRDEYGGDYFIGQMAGPFKSKDDADAEAARCDRQTTFWRYRVLWCETTVKEKPE